MASSSSSSSWQAAVRDNPLLEAKLNEFLDTGKMMGEGSVGTVKHVICRGVGATKKHAGQGFALKVIEKSTIEKHKLQNHLHEEVRLHMRLRHQNIVRLHTHMEDSKRIYILLDLCDKTLFQHLRDHPSGMPVDSNEPASFLLDTAHGLQYLHQQDILHRDIKPENLLLHKNKGSKKYRILIADFGWSKESHIGEERKTFCGTLDYLAPEMVDNFNQGFGVDIWALGILLYEMLTGRAPWDGKTQGACVQQIKNCEASVSFPDQVPTSARQLIRSILRRQPEQRAPIEHTNHEYIVKRTGEVSRPGTEVHVMPRPSPIDHLTIDTSSPVVGSVLPSAELPRSSNVSSKAGSRFGSALHSVDYPSANVESPASANLASATLPSSTLPSTQRGRHIATATGSLGRDEYTVPRARRPPHDKLFALCRDRKTNLPLSAWIEKTVAKGTFSDKPTSNFSSSANTPFGLSRTVQPKSIYNSVSMSSAMNISNSTRAPTNLSSTISTPTNYDHLAASYLTRTPTDGVDKLAQTHSAVLETTISLLERVQNRTISLLPDNSIVVSPVGHERDMFKSLLQLDALPELHR